MIIGFFLRQISAQADRAHCMRHFLDWAAEEITPGEFDGDLLNLTLLSMSGPQDGQIGVADYDNGWFMSSKDGISSEDKIEGISVPLHGHLSWYFTKPGLYKLTFQVSGTVGGVTETNENAFTFQVVPEPSSLVLLAAALSVALITYTFQRIFMHRLCLNLIGISIITISLSQYANATTYYNTEGHTDLEFGKNATLDPHYYCIGGSGGANVNGVIVSTTTDYNASDMVTAIPESTRYYVHNSLGGAGFNNCRAIGIECGGRLLVSPPIQFRWWFFSVIAFTILGSRRRKK